MNKNDIFEIIVAVIIGLLMLFTLFLGIENYLACDGTMMRTMWGYKCVDL